MHDRPIIYAGLLIFLGFATLPVWRNLSLAATTKGPQPVLPASKQECVASITYMKASHMDLLNNWRDAAIRRGDRVFQGANGKTYAIGLTSTCLKQCHTEKADFCDRCHNYAGVSPECWNCHLDSKPVVLRSAR